MYGAEIVYSPGKQGSNGAVAMALEMAEGDASYYMPYQYGNQANPDAHYNGTAVEILEELDEVAAFVGGLGTGGTLMGNARRLKEENPDTLIVAAEPLQGELVQGLRSLEDGYIPPIIDLSLLDRKIFVSNRDAVVWTKRLLDEEGLFVGVSSGAVASIAVRVAERARRGQRRVRRHPTTAGSTSAPASTPSRSRSSSGNSTPPPSGSPSGRSSGGSLARALAPPAGSGRPSGVRRIGLGAAPGSTSSTSSSSDTSSSS